MLYKIYNKVKIFFIFGLFSSYVSSCFFWSKYPLEDYYARNYDKSTKSYAYDADVFTLPDQYQDSQSSVNAPVEEDVDDVDDDQLSNDESSQQAVSETTTVENNANDETGDDLAATSPQVEPNEPAQTETTEVIDPTDDKKTARANMFDALVADTLKGNSIEEKIFFSIARDFESRNHDDFFRFSDEFLISYPDSIFRGQVEYMRANFYYQTTFDRQLLSEGIIELGKLGVRSWEEFDKKISELSDYNIQAVVFSPFQSAGVNVVPFENSSFNSGALFKTNVVSFVNNALDNLSKILAAHGIKLYIKLPVRKHDWLNYSYSSLMDQTWESSSQTSFYNSQLNLLHPKAANYLKDLINDIAKYEIAGIILGSDYATSALDGISSLNNILYQTETGRDFRASGIPQRVIDFEESDVRDANFDDGSFSANFINFNNWRAIKIHLLLMDLITSVKSAHPTLQMGVEVLPQLVNYPKSSLYNRSVSYIQVIGLPADFFMLSNKIIDLDNSIIIPDTISNMYIADYLKSAQTLVSFLKPHQQLMLKVYYSERLDSFLSINRKLAAVRSSGIRNASVVLGPLSSFTVFEDTLKAR